jgi:5-methyltetrahydrofolate--homocysteine methyltransferase
MNPYSAEMMKTYYTFKALKGLDENCADYISVAEKFSSTVIENKKELTSVTENNSSELMTVVIKGFKEKAGEITKELLKTKAPLDIVNNEIIPALNEVGVGYENKTIYLPQLLMSAESSKSSFEVIKEFMSNGKKAESKGKVIIATVKGDIHDIGKNIVKLLLENYGFDVIDLGKDVPPETVAETVIETNAQLVGLSALMTTTVPAMEETIKLLKTKAPWCKVVVGGAVLTQEYADKIGADKYAKDAMETVRFAERILK